MAFFFQFAFIEACFGSTFAEGVFSLLAGHPFFVDWVKSPDTIIWWAAGQPLGYLSSWSLFALNHHLMVWYCADKVYPGRLFTDYAVLGDDIVIADKLVAEEYLDQLARFGIPVSKQKTLVSDSGAAEFAKRFWIRGLTVDLSPVSLTCCLNTHHPYGLLGLHNTYPIRRFSTLLRIGGFTKRSIGSAPRRQDPKVSRILKMVQRSSLPTELWLGRGRPLNPYLRGILIDFMRDRLRPKELSVLPDEVIVTESAQVLAEYTSLRSWLKQWLGYVKWYHLVASSPTVTLQELMEAPVVNRKWQIESTDPELVRLGLEGLRSGSLSRT